MADYPAWSTIPILKDPNMNREEIAPQTKALLDRYGFDRQTFEQLREAIRRGTLSLASNAVTGHVAPPRKEDIVSVPLPGETRYTQAMERGLKALRAGQVAAAILNGGMATRFGGVVKGTVEAVDGKSFLEWKLSEVGRLEAALATSIQTLIMNSFATDAATRTFIDALRNTSPDLPNPSFFTQGISIRLRPDGSTFRDASGAPSLYAPGHGDFPWALQVSGEIDRLRRAGVRWITLSNVDNLGARLDPTVVGMHILSGKAMTVEVVERRPGDTGGAPARVDDRLTLIEGFRFPNSFDPAQIPVFNTNTFVFDLEILAQPIPLTWFFVEKSVDGQQAIQLERLVGELPSFHPAQFLEVPREGHRGRFFPIKTPADLEATRPVLRTMLAASVLDD
jgi:UTP--glucose-1-phosphate uridylyltransferase